jgi:rod shape determining protein RodA
MHTPPPLYHLAKETDFIFTSVGEEFGLLGCIALLLLFAVVIGYGVRIAMSSRSQFGRLLALGLTLNFFFYIMNCRTGL